MHLHSQSLQEVLFLTYQTIQVTSSLNKWSTIHPDIKASTIYQTRTITLGDNIKNLVIVIPNEGHKSHNAKPKELRVVNQPYIPQNAVVNAGATVT